MSATVSVAGQRRALEALVQLTDRFPDLPALHVSLMSHTPDTLSLYLHDDLGAFEAWRQALNFPSDSVTCGSQSGGRTLTLKVCGEFNGLSVELHGFAPALPAPADVAEGAAA
jgi:hypothetical protein